MEFIDPVTGIRRKKFAHRLAIFTIEIDRVGPFGLMALRFDIVGEFIQIVVDIAEVVVDHIQNYGETFLVCPIDEGAKIIRHAVQPAGGEHVHAVVTPAETAGKIGHRHQFDGRDADAH